jgi:hypothetical protein
MEKEKKRKILLASLGVVLLFFIGSMGWVFVKILTRPGPKQEQLEKLKAQKSPLDPQIKKLEELQAKYGEAIEEMEDLPEFSPPKDGLITEDQMRRFADIFSSVVNALEEARKQIPEGKKSIGEGLLYLNQLYLTAQGMQAVKQIEHRMSSREYEWIEQRIREAQIVALLRLEKLTDNEEERKKIRAYARVNAEILGYAITDERGELVGKPEMLDPNKVPPQHVRYVLGIILSCGNPTPQFCSTSLTGLPYSKQKACNPLLHPPSLLVLRHLLPQKVPPRAVLTIPLHRNRIIT